MNEILTCSLKESDQPKRINGGFVIPINKFTDVDPDKDLTIQAMDVNEKVCAYCFSMAAIKTSSGVLSEENGDFSVEWKKGLITIKGGKYTSDDSIHLIISSIQDGDKTPKYLYISNIEEQWL